MYCYVYECTKKSTGVCVRAKRIRQECSFYISQSQSEWKKTDWCDVIVLLRNCTVRNFMVLLAVALARWYTMTICANYQLNHSETSACLFLPSFYMRVHSSICREASIYAIFMSIRFITFYLYSHLRTSLTSTQVECCLITSSVIRFKTEIKLCLCNLLAQNWIIQKTCHQHLVQCKLKKTLLIIRIISNKKILSITVVVPSWVIVHHIVHVYLTEFAILQVRYLFFVYY